ncbi:MAG: pilin [Candidatus Saccharimonadales bacterium]
MFNLYPIFAAACDTKAFLGFLPHWWEYLKTEETKLGCQINFTPPGDLWLVGLAILDMLLRLAGLAAVISIMVAGAQYIFAGGNPEKAASARKRIYNSLIGLAIALIATVVVVYIGRRFAT